jgi:ubiquinone biosynthesis protein UbiJ
MSTAVALALNRDGEPMALNFPNPAGSGFGQSTSAPSLSGLRQQAEQTRSEVGEALDRGRAGIAGSASVARDSFAEDMSRLRDDVASLKETLARFASQAGSEASQTLRQVGQTVASQVGTAASGLAEAGSVRVVFDNAQFLAWYRERFPINAM